MTWPVKGSIVSAMVQSHPSRSERRLLPLALWLGTLAGLLVALSRLDGGVLAPPAVRAPETWGDWVSARGPVEVAFALLRLVVVVLAWYLAGSTTIGLVARLLRLTPLVTAADLLTVPAVRRLLQGALGVGLATAALVAVRPGPRSVPAPAVVRAAAVSTGAPAVMRQLDPDEPGRATMRRLPDDAPPPSSPAPNQAWRVEPGDHFWSMAEQTLTRAWGRAPTDGEVVPYWRAVIEANRASLADRGNPDLLYPGQLLTVPPPPPA